MLLQKEQQNFIDDPKKWIEREAIEQRHLQDYGTFREALIRCVEDRLTSILSKILVQADVNNNLMLLKESRYVDLWVKLFEKVVSDLQETETQEHLGKGLQSAKFPFSGKVSKMIHDTIKKQMHHGMKSYYMYLTALS